MSVGYACPLFVGVTKNWNLWILLRTVCYSYNLLYKLSLSTNQSLIVFGFINNYILSVGYACPPLVGVWKNRKLWILLWTVCYINNLLYKLSLSANQSLIIFGFIKNYVLSVGFACHPLVGVTKKWNQWILLRTVCYSYNL